DTVARAPGTQFLITQAPGASKITQMTLLDVAKAFPHIAHVSSGADIDRNFRVGRRVSQWRRTALLREGNGLRINHHSLVKRARAHILQPLPSAVGPQAPRAH